VPAIPCFALLCGAEFLGTFIGQLFSLAVDKNPVVLAVFLLLMVIAAAMVLMGSRLYLAQPVPATISLDERVVALGSRCNLSPREQEIMLIWLTGHNSSYIEKKLTISKNTVKTHLSHIYAKTNTANKEELLALVSPPEEGQ
jgi:DNA-binding CsgD family transcriptional regulator